MNCIRKLSVVLIFGAAQLALAQDNPQDEILTPPAPPTPRVNGPKIFGVRPEHPFLYTIPATGDRPMTFSVENLPAGLKVDTKTGQITGTLDKPGEYNVVLRASNNNGADNHPLKIVVGDTIALTPPLGWNSWNAWGGSVDQGKILEAAKAMVSSGLVNHGWTYINIDDSWQGDRGGDYHGLQGNKKFPDMKGMCDQIHAMGLKPGIYSTPWTTSYARYPGGSSENEDGKWTKPTVDKKGKVNNKTLPWAIGKYSFAKNDAQQFAAWGFDYLKYDWNPIEAPETQEMYDALNAAGRDLVYSLSNNSGGSLKKSIDAVSKIGNSWRVSGDIRDNWKSVTGEFANIDKWQQYQQPGHWNDPDMLVVGYVGWGKPHMTGLSPDEQYTHISMWCLLSSPLLIGCDMSKLDPFTTSLLSNDEVLAVNQDSLGKQARPIVNNNDTQIWAKDLDDGSKAVGLLNLGDGQTTVTFNFSDAKISGKQTIRDLWRQKDVGTFSDKYEAQVASHGVVLVRVIPAK